MERRRFARIAVNLNVTLLDDTALPRGCRVRDVSQGGMLLQFEHSDGDTPYEPEQTVKVRASLKDGEQRRVLLMPATIRRVLEKGIGVEFQQPQAELMQLLEPYELDRDTTAVAPAMVAERSAAAGGASRPAFAATRPRHRDNLDNGGARLAERIAAARESIARSGHLSSGIPPPDEQASAHITDRRMLQVGLASLAVAAAIVIFDLAGGASTRQRLAALELAAQRQAETLADVQIRLTADRDRERIASLDERVDQLAVTLAALETGTLVPADSETAVPPKAESGANHEQIAAASKPQPAQTAPSPKPDAPAATVAIAEPAGSAESAGSGDGPWVINLVSLYEQAAADRFTRRAHELGLAVEQNQAQVNGRPVWRLQVAGFATRDEAQAYSDANKDKLGLKKVWIFKR